jgi:hypothetical protein
MILGSFLIENQTDDVLRMSLIKSLLLRRRNHIIGRSDDLAKVADSSLIIIDPAERNNHGHLSFSPFLRADKRL